MKKYYILIIIFVIFINIFSFSAEKHDEKMFFLNSSKESSFFDYYNTLLNEKNNVILTSDFLFYIEHLYMDYSLRYIEKTYLIDKYSQLLSSMIEYLENTRIYYETPKILASFDQSLSYLYVCKKLLDNKFSIPFQYKNTVNKEIKLINTHSKIEKSNIFSKDEDFTQYKPRGHYNDDEQLKAYFKSMMYFQRMQFNIDIEKEFFSMLIFTSTLSQSNIIKIYKQMNNILSIYLPQSDNITIYQTLDYIHFSISKSFFKDKTLLNSIKSKLINANNSKIISDIVSDSEKKPILIGLMGQRYIFDSEVFQNLVYDKVKQFTGKKHAFTLWKNIRVFPRGLDFMYVLGSKEAFDILKNNDDTKYINYKENIEIMKDNVSKLNYESFYNKILRQYILVFNNKNKIEFMISNYWKYKELNTLLASWASLRHDVILYAKPSYTVKLTAHGPMPDLNKTRIIAEPYTEVYKQMKNDFEELYNRFYFDKKLQNSINSIIKLIDLYSEISNLTLHDKFYSNKDNTLNLIGNVNIQLKSLLIDKKTKKDNSIIIADIHTDVNSGQVLEEATGYISNFKVIMKNIDFYGGVFQYYEFKQPINNRLSDEEWRKIIDINSNKYLSKWQKLLYD